MKMRILAIGLVAVAWACSSSGPATAITERRILVGVRFQTIADIGKMEWAPLKLEGLPAGIEIAVLR